MKIHTALFILISIAFAGCRTIDRSTGSGYDFTEIDYFIKLTTDKLHPCLMRWEDTVVIGVFGDPRIADIETVNEVSLEINELLGPNKLLRIEEDSNVNIFFGSFEEIRALRAKFGEDDLSWASIYFWVKDDKSLDQVWILVSDALLSEATRAGTIRALITSALGFPRPVDKPGFRVFTKFIDNMANSYSESDKEMIKLLYHDQLVSGMERNSLRKHLPDLVRK